MNPQPSPQQTPHQQDTEFYRETLNQLIVMGTRIAQTITDQATQPASPPHTPDQAHTLTLAFDRVTRAVRRTALLAERFAEAPARAATAAKSRDAARKQILREVEDAIHRQAPEPDAPNLNAELQERIDAPELEEDIGNRPTADIIADICRDLGVPVNSRAFKFKRRTPAEVLALCMRAAAPPKPPAYDRPMAAAATRHGAQRCPGQHPAAP